MTWTVPLPYDHPPLSLNDRGQTIGARQAKSRVVAEIRHSTAVMARAAGIGPQQAIHVRLHYRPGDNRRRDPDNLTATAKPSFDGLVDAGVVPDDALPYLDWSRPVIHPAVKGKRGALWLVVEAVEPAAVAL